MLGGLYMTLEVSMLALLFATLWGSVICALRMSRSRWLRAPARIYIELMRSLPLLVLLLVSLRFSAPGLPAWRKGSGKPVPPWG